MIYRWEYMDDQVLKKLLPPMPWYAIPIYRYYLKKQTHAQGMGRHTLEELQHIGRMNLRALSDFMGMYCSKNIRAGRIQVKILSTLPMTTPSFVLSFKFSVA